ncbi:hypothetical protein, partial [Sphingomonas trueperi]|uniref:hypothetical protein n=1 Tax=Sphingomonas trueperi TaxID=53317 RepID=UPI0031D0FE9E
MTLTPGGGLLASGYDKDGPVRGTITAEGHDEFDGWEWSMHPSPPAGLVVETSGAALTEGWMA